MRDSALYGESPYHTLRLDRRLPDVLSKRTHTAKSKRLAFRKLVPLVLLGMMALFAPPAIKAQRCKGNLDVGCTNAGALCSPVDSGVGPFGHCTTPSGLPKGERECECVGAPKPPPPPPFDLTGIWSADDGGIYYLRQIGNDLWWAGFDPDPFSTATRESGSFQRGLTYAQVFRGTISGDLITGEWAEVPRQSSSNLHQGTVGLLLDSVGGVVSLSAQTQTGGFAPKAWTRSSVPPLPCSDGAGKRDLYCLFAKVLKNQTETFWGSHESLLDNLKPYKDNVAVFGTVTEPYSLSLSSGSGVSCSDFFKFHDSDDDLTFDIWADRQNLDAQPGFWTNGWINSAANVQGKLNYWQNSVHCEIIMFGRQHTECSPGDTVFLPGWAESGANSALANGTPINGGLIIPGYMRAGSRVRVTGPLVLDCGHGVSSPCYESENDSDNSDTNNLEIHPVYSVDVLQDFAIPRAANIDLTGPWAASDVGTYYVTQIGNTVWWLGLSTDQGLTFANVFKGVIQSSPGGWFPVISGQWASLPLGSTQGNGDLTLAGTFCKSLNDSTVPCDPSQRVTAWNLLLTQSSSSPLFANPPSDRFQWQKLFDRNTNPIPQIVAPSFFSLGKVTNGDEAQGSVPISNIGTAPLIIQTITSGTPGLEFSPASLTIDPGTTASITLSWLAVAKTTSPGTPGCPAPGKGHVLNGELVLKTNDPITPGAVTLLQLIVCGEHPE
jgi:hypothetical protein